MGEGVLGQREDQRDRLDLRDVDQADGIARLNDVSFVDLPDTGHAVDRRGKAGVGQINLRGFNQSLIRFDNGLELVHLRLLRVHQLARGEALRQKRRVTVQVCLGIDELRLVAIAGGGHLVDLCLIRSRIDLRQQIALFDLLALGEGDLRDFS